MTYIYRCEKCSKDVEVNKSMYETSRKEYCIKCGSEMIRVFKSTAIFTSDGVKI